MRFLRDYRPKWTQVEYPVYNVIGGYAGTLDRMGTIDGQRAIVDIKTTSSMDRASKISLATQLVGYDMASFAMGHPEAAIRLGVQLKSDGTYTPHDSAKISEKYNFSPAKLFANLLFIKQLTGGYIWERK
jgi:hypothetical protein